MARLRLALVEYRLSRAAGLSVARSIGVAWYWAGWGC